MTASRFASLHCLDAMALVTQQLTLRMLLDY
jgi:hypothetical protein